MTHISYECAKRIKELLGSKAPDAMDGHIWTRGSGNGPEHHFSTSTGFPPAYQLHDLLSNGFYEAMAEKLWGHKRWASKIFDNLAPAYWKGGLPAVEASLMRMMEEAI